MEKTELLACPLTDAEIIHIFENSRLQSEHFTKESVTAAYVAALATLRSRTPSSDNKPLTVEELREMDEQAVWVEHLWPPECGIKDKAYLVSADEEELISTTGSLTFEEACGVCGLAYRRPPEEE